MSGQLQMDSPQQHVFTGRPLPLSSRAAAYVPPVRQPAARDLPDCLIAYLRTGRGQPAGHATGGVRVEGRVSKEPGTPIARTAVGSPGDPSRWVVLWRLQGILGLHQRVKTAPFPLVLGRPSHCFACQIAGRQSSASRLLKNPCCERPRRCAGCGRGNRCRRRGPASPWPRTSPSAPLPRPSPG